MRLILQSKLCDGESHTTHGTAQGTKGLVLCEKILHLQVAMVVTYFRTLGLFRIEIFHQLIISLIFKKDSFGVSEECWPRLLLQPKSKLEIRSPIRLVRDVRVIIAHRRYDKYF